MTLLFEHTRRGCVVCGESVEDHPIGYSVSAGDQSRPEDVKIVQQLLNAVPAARGGPAVALAVDGLCGPKTHAAIVGYQNAALGWSDGRVDPSGPTIRHLVGFVLESPEVPNGPLQAPSAGGSAHPVTDGAVIVLYALAIMRFLAPPINLLRWRLSRADANFLAFLGKHFSTRLDHARSTDIRHLQKVLSDIDKYIARCNAFGKLLVENVILYDPDPSPDFIGRTTRGGNKMSTRQTQLYRTATGKVYKSPGQSIWLSSLWGEEITYEKHLSLLHEAAHFVGPRDGNPAIIDDYAQCFEHKFLTMSRRAKLHNAERVALFILEFCVGTTAILTMPRLQANISHFSKFPRVEHRELIMS
jgi:hypothetical protein